MKQEKIEQQNATIIRQNKTIIRLLKSKGLKIELPVKTEQSTSGKVKDNFEGLVRSKTYKRL